MTTATPPPNNDVPRVSTPSQTSEFARAVTSEELLKGGRELLIRHGGETYRLRLTRNGKLILQK